jgi:hypothetical protein
MKLFGNLLEFMRNSKSRFIRGAVMEMVQTIAEYWPVDVLKKYSAKIRELTDLGLADAGPAARDAAREALTLLHKKMPDVSVNNDCK